MYLSFAIADDFIICLNNYKHAVKRIKEHEFTVLFFFFIFVDTLRLFNKSACKKLIYRWFLANCPFCASRLASLFRKNEIVTYSRYRILIKFVSYKHIILQYRSISFACNCILIFLSWLFN